MLEGNGRGGSTTTNLDESYCVIFQNIISFQQFCSRISLFRLVCVSSWGWRSKDCFISPAPSFYFRLHKQLVSHWHIKQRLLSDYLKDWLIQCCIILTSWVTPTDLFLSQRRLKTRTSEKLAKLPKCLSDSKYMSENMPLFLIAKSTNDIRVCYGSDNNFLYKRPLWIGSNHDEFSEAGFTKSWESLTGIRADLVSIRRSKSHTKQAPVEQTYTHADN